MFRRLFERRGRAGSPEAMPASAASRTPQGEIVYAIGDIHGRYDLLSPLLDAIVAEADAAAGRTKVVFLGDYVDRGPDSNKVLQRLVEMRAQREVEAIFLVGNHDEMLLKFLKDPAAGPVWAGFGGRQTLISYGVQPPNGRDAEAWTEASEALAAAVPEAHRLLLEDAAESVIIGDYFFAHAGARPGIPLERQVRSDLLWIREAFLEDATPFDKVVVHGHTPAEAIHADGRRIGLDTGAYATGVLSAAKLWADQRSFLQAAAVANQPLRVLVRRASTGLDEPSAAES